MPQSNPITIFGGSSFVGSYLIQRLHERGLIADVVSRQPMALPEGFTHIHLDLAQSRNWIVPENSTVISLLPLWILPQFLPRFMGAKAIIAVGSTSRYSKADSHDKHEQDMGFNLAWAEDTIQTWAQKGHVTWTILRTTLIYDGVHDSNIARVIRFVRRWKFYPLASPGLGLRQPIHADDVANAVINCLDNPATANNSFNIAGQEILPYRTMIERVFMAVGLPPRFVTLPTSWFIGAFVLASKLGVIREKSFGADMFRRMNHDLVFETALGLEAIGYKPRGFSLSSDKI